MDFFAQQARVRGSSRRLVVLFVLAVVAIVAVIDAVVWISLGHRPVSGEPARSNVTLLFTSTLVVIGGIALSSLFRIMSLSGGGKAVAESVGGVPVPPDTRDPQLRQLRNVIEEVAIAAGVPVPDIYLMQNEPGINAFAAGYSTSDAAICVTRGCLDQLSRDELQGVIAHEFSHVLNGDMRLNIRLMGLLFGILVLAIVGRQVIWFGGGRSNRRDGGGGQVWMIGLALVAVGYIGYFFGRLIQAAVARSRESLADASAVQFTRQTEGIAGALKKIAILSEGSELQVANKQEVAHMLFGEAGAFNALFATHPPLLQRIRALEPGFQEAELERLAASLQNTQATGATARPDDPSTSGFAPPPLPVSNASTPAVAAQPAPLNAGSFQHAGSLRQSLPDTLTLAAQQPESALSLVLALATSTHSSTLIPQQRLVADAFGDDVQHAAAVLATEVNTLAPALRMPLVALAFPALKQLPAGRRQTLLTAFDALVRMDGQIDLDDYCLIRLLRMQLVEATQPRRAPVDGQKKLPASRDSVRLVCAVVATYGATDETSARRAWLLAMQQAFPGEALNWQTPPAAWQAPFERALDDLDGLMPAAKETLIQSLVSAVQADGVVTSEEAELVRVICASLHCPLPPQAGLRDA